MWIRNRSVVPMKEIFSEEYKDSVVQVITGISSPLQNITARLYLRTAGVTYKEAGNYTCVANNTVRGQVSVTEQVLQILCKLWNPYFTLQNFISISLTVLKL